MEGNSASNIRTEGKAFVSEIEKKVVRSIFGDGNNTDHKKYSFNHGIASQGFHISSCQFSMHYFFESKNTLHNFLRNLAECTRLHGYFIGTCYDGKSVFEKLHKRADGSIIKMNDSIRIDKHGNKMFEIVKKYNSNIQEFPEDENSIGMPINVYQDSIDKMFKEYLVNFDYFTRLMENYGFVLIDKQETKSIGFSEASGTFRRLFDSMKRENDEDNKYLTAGNMSSDEKTISFLNRYFIFKKVREISQATLKSMQKTLQDEQEAEEAEAEERIQDDNAKIKEKNDVENTNDKKAVKKVRKVKQKKIVLKESNYSPLDLKIDDPDMQQYYNGLKEKSKKIFATMPERDQILMLEDMYKQSKKRK